MFCWQTDNQRFATGRGNKRAGFSQRRYYVVVVGRKVMVLV